MDNDYLDRWRIVAAFVALGLVIVGLAATITTKPWAYAGIGVLIIGEIIGRIVQRKRADW